MSTSDTLVLWSVSDAGWRWYDPVTGRWTSNDPIGISGGLNQYVFCGDDAVNRRDPTGLSFGQPWNNFTSDFRESMNNLGWGMKRQWRSLAEPTQWRDTWDNWLWAGRSFRRQFYGGADRPTFHQRLQKDISGTIRNGGAEAGLLTAAGLLAGAGMVESAALFAEATAGLIAIGPEGWGFALFTAAGAYESLQIANDFRVGIQNGWYPAQMDTGSR